MERRAECRRNGDDMSETLSRLRADMDEVKQNQGKFSESWGHMQGEVETLKGNVETLGGQVGDVSSKVDEVHSVVTAARVTLSVAGDAETVGSIVHKRWRLIAFLTSAFGAIWATVNDAWSLAWHWIARHL